MREISKQDHINQVSKIFKVSARQIYKDFDKHISKMQNSCKKGCTHCCNQSVNVFMWEEKIIADYVRNKLTSYQKSVLKRNIENWFKNFNSVTPEASRDNPLCREEFSHAEYMFREHRMPCPLLHDNSCMIYKVRPIVCRAHIVNDNPNMCIENPHRRSEKKAYELRNYVIENFDFTQLGLPKEGSPTI